MNICGAIRMIPIPSWLTRAARILRGEGQEASSASVIEALRLSNSLAGMRGRPLPGWMKRWSRSRRCSVRAIRCRWIFSARNC